MNDDGQMIRGARGMKANPAAAMWKLAADTLLKTSDRLGLSPGTRARLNVPSRGEKLPSKWDGLID